MSAMRDKVAMQFLEPRIIHCAGSGNGGNVGKVVDDTITVLSSSHGTVNWPSLKHCGVGANEI